MKNGWETKTLGEVLTLEYGKPLPEKARRPDGAVPVYGANGIKAWTNKPYVDDAGIIVGRKGSAGEVNLCDSSFWPLDVTYFVRFDNRRYNLRFLFFLLKSLDLPSLAKGIKPGLNRNDAYAKPVLVPSLPEQHRIVTILDEAFEGIAAAKAIAEKNLGNAKEVFHAARHRSIYSPSEDWTTTQIGRQILLQRGFDITKRQQRPGSIPVVSSGGIKSFHDVPQARGPGVVMGRKGSIGTVFFVEQDFWPHDTTLWVKDFRGNDPRYVFHFLSTLDVASLNTGTANPALNRNQIHPLAVKWPSVEEQRRIAKRLNDIEVQCQSMVACMSQQKTVLDELKASLLHQAFTGQL